MRTARRSARRRWRLLAGAAAALAVVVALALWAATRFPARQVELAGTPYALLVQDGVPPAELASTEQGLRAGHDHLADEVGAAGGSAPGAPEPGSVDRVGVRLEVLDETSPCPLLTAVEELAVAPGQEEFVLIPRVTLPVALDDEDRTPFAVLADAPRGGGAPGPDAVVGFGVLDRHGYLEQVLDQPERTVLLRAFCISERHQGRGLGAAAARAVRSLGVEVAPSADLVVLTVSTRNTAGQRAYARAGFADTGIRYEGTAGVEWVMTATTLRSARPAPQGRVSAGRT